MSLQISSAQAAAILLKRRGARQSLTSFARSQGFEPAPHHALLISELEILARGDSDFLLVEMPPGSAKSTYVNWLFPAWFLAGQPGSDVLSASHSSELAERWGRRTRNLIASAGPILGTGLSADSTAAYRWSTTGGSEFYSVGVGVGIMGFRARLGIIDDPFGSREDAESKRTRDKVWEWYTNDFSSRLRPGAKRVIMHQRFHEDDLAGRVVQQLDKIGKPYRRLKIRAEATENDPLGRKPGEMLWDDPGGYDYGRFLRDRKLELTADPRTWSSLYQQEPTPDTGDYFKRDWLIPVDVVPDRKNLRLYGGSDYAVSSGRGDYTVHVVVGIDSDENPWLVDLWRKQASSEEWVSSLCDLVIKWKPLGWAEETGQIKSGVGPFLEREMRDRKAYTSREQFPTRGDKAVRAQSFRGLIATRGLRIPAHASWRGEFETELLRFPAGIHDDQVDACVAEGTAILMEDGNALAIENVRVGDNVATPLGACRVLAAEETNAASKVFRVTVTSGRSLVATANHPIFSDHSGFVRVDALRLGDKIVMEPPCARDRLPLKSLSIAGIDIGDIQKARVKRTSGTSTPQSRGADFCIGTCGKMNEVLFQSATKSIIEIAIGLVTRSATLLASLRKSIGNVIASSATLTQSKLFILKVSETRPRNGTHPLMGLHGIESMAFNLGKGVKHSKERALLAAFPSWPSSPALVFAPADANKEAMAAALPSRGDSHRKVSPLHVNAVTGYLSANGPTSQHIVPKHVECVTAIEELLVPVRVLNLTVDRASAYYANGFLTHNCGLVGQLLDKMIGAAKPKKIEPDRRDGYVERRSGSRDDGWMTL